MPKREQARSRGHSAEFPILSRELLGTGPAVWIEHDGALYCLRVTRQGRLILTK